MGRLALNMKPLPLISLAGSVVLTLSTACSFTRNFAEKPNVIGSVAPSSPRLAQYMVKYINKDLHPKRILEVGAGTGSFTHKIVAMMNQDDHLDIIEIEPDLCSILNEEFGQMANVSIHCIDVLKWQPETRYDAIVSGLPFNAFDSSLVGQITERYTKLLAPEGTLSFFEYLWIPKIRDFFSRGEERASYIKTRKSILDFVSSYGFDEENVYLNLTPAKVYYLRNISPKLAERPIANAEKGSTNSR